MAIALGFAVLLLPYSLIGPFAGVLLDRWSRRNVLIIANIVRAAVVPAVAAMIWVGIAAEAFLPLVLIVVGGTRLVSAAVSAALPHVVDEKELVTANSFISTAGGLAYAVGIAAAMGLRPLFGASDHGYAIIALMSVLGYVGTALVIRKFTPNELGPDDVPDSGGVSVARLAWHELRTGAQHLAARKNAAGALLVVVGMRVFFGAALIAVVLLYRNYFTADGFFRTHETGLGQIMFASAAGNLIAAGITPAATRLFGTRQWLGMLLPLAAAAQLGLGILFTMPGLIAASFLVAIASQGARLVAETTLQTECADEYRGRVFSVFDTLFNACLVLGLVAGAAFLPETGKSYAALIVISVGYGLLAAGYLWLSRGSTLPVMPAKPKTEPAQALTQLR